MDNSRKTPTQFAGRGFNFDVSDLTYWGNLGGSFKWSRRINDRFYVNTLVSYSNYYSQRDRSTSGNSTQPDGTVRTFKNGLRLPNYHRMDVAATFNLHNSTGANRSIGISLFNVYNRTNVWYNEFQIQENKVIETNVNFLGFTPNLNLSWRLR
jgi:hypothetical protein